jgi:shikimate kinase
MDSRIFLIGFMGSGKSTLGSKLAHRIGHEFIDMDRLIEETADMSIPEIFNEHGEEVFRKWESDIMHELCSKEKLVVATGGGAPCHSDLMQLMNEHGTTIYLRLSPDELKSRLIRSRTERPLIKHKSEEELIVFIENLLEQREQYYNQANYIVNGINLHPEELANLLMDS